jgi:hypothetical protein
MRAASRAASQRVRAASPSFWVLPPTLIAATRPIKLAGSTGVSWWTMLSPLKTNRPARSRRRYRWTTITPLGSQNAQISAILGCLEQLNTWTWLPAEIVGSMDTPSTGSHTPSRALERTKAATSSGRGIAIAGLPVWLVVNEPALVDEVAQLFAPMPDHPGPYDARITFEANAPELPDRPADEVYGPISLWRDGTELVLDSGGPLRAVATPSQVIVGGVVGDDALGTMLLRRIVHHVIAHVLSLSGRLVAHGAAVGRHGRAVLLLGASGAGKSSSAYLASVGGWALLSDDLVVVMQVASGIEAVGVHRAIAVPPDVIAVEAVDIAHDLRDRRRPEVTLSARVHRLAAVALVEHGGARGVVERVSGVAIASAFLGSTPAAGNLEVAAEALKTAAGLATLPCFRLRIPDTAKERVAATAGLFDQLAESAGIPF